MKKMKTLQAGTAVGLLAGVGHAYRIHQRYNNAVAKIEDMIRSSIDEVLIKFEEFCDISDLLEQAQLLAENPTSARLLDFYEERDDLELAWHIASKYNQEETPEPWPVLGQIRDFLDRVDDEILFEEQLVKQLQEIGRLEQEGPFDLEYFWWLSDWTELPDRRFEQYLAGYMLPEGVRVKFEQYLLAHPELQEQ